MQRSGISSVLTHSVDYANMKKEFCMIFNPREGGKSISLIKKKEFDAGRQLWAKTHEATHTCYIPKSAYS